MAGTDGNPVSTPPRGGARRGAKPKRSIQPRLVLLGVWSFVALLGWAVLVWVAIGSGRSARGGSSGKWVALVGASIGAVACLFLSLWLLTVLLRRMGILEDKPKPARPATSDQPHRH